ncbi:hypothetical protein P8452_55300 [Trifolium repens]|nr:hypothetical protein P8452_55300 [Trifolium repens]
MNSILWIQTSDGIPQKIDTVAMFCPLIYKEIMEHGKGFSDDYPVLLPECVSTSIFNLVMDYCQFYHISERPEKECQVFNDKFINKDKKTLCDLGTAAISLGLNHLLDMTLEELDRQTIGLNSKQVSKVLLKGINPFNMGNSRYEFMQKFFDIKKQGPKERLKKDVERLEDVRPIDDLLQYINAKDGDTKEEDTTRKKKKKKNRRKKLEKEKEKEKDGEELEYNQENYFDDFDPLIMESIDSFSLCIEMWKNSRED